MQKMRRMALHKRQVGVVPGGPDDDPTDPAASSSAPATSNAPPTSAAQTTTAVQSSTSAPPASSATPASSTAAAVSSSSSAVVSSSSTTRITITAERPSSATPTRTSATTSIGITTRPPISRVPTGTPTTSPSISPSPSATPDNGAPVGTIVGVIAAGLVGVIALAAAAGWFFRRTFRKKKDDFNRGKFMRHSTAIPDGVDYSNEKVPMGSKNALNLARANTIHDREINPRGPRPPTMIERHVNQADTTPSFRPGEVMGGPVGGYYQDPQAAYQYGGYGQAYGNGYGYNQPQDAYYNYSASAYTPPNEHQQSELVRRPSGPGSAYLQRQRSNAAALQQQGYAVSPPGEYAAGRHESVTPYQQQQYEEISRQLNDPSYTGERVTVTDADGKEAPAVAHNGQENPNLGRSLSTSYSSLNPNKPSPAAPVDMNRSGTPTDPNPQQNYYQPNTHGHNLQAPTQQPGAPANKRESVFDADDAYGGM